MLFYLPRGSSPDLLPQTNKTINPPDASTARLATRGTTFHPPGSAAPALEEEGGVNTAASPGDTPYRLPKAPLTHNGKAASAISGLRELLC